MSYDLAFEHLRAADPATVEPVEADALFDAIVAQPADPRLRRKRLRATRRWRFVAVAAAALVGGVAAAWAPGSGDLPTIFASNPARGGTPPPPPTGPRRPQPPHDLRVHPRRRRNARPSADGTLAADGHPLDDPTRRCALGAEGRRRRALVGRNEGARLVQRAAPAERQLVRNGWQRRGRCSARLLPEPRRDERRQRDTRVRDQRFRLLRDLGRRPRRRRAILADRLRRHRVPEASGADPRHRLGPRGDDLEGPLLRAPRAGRPSRLTLAEAAVPPACLRRERQGDRGLRQAAAVATTAQARRP